MEELQLRANSNDRSIANFPAIDFFHSRTESNNAFAFNPNSPDLMRIASEREVAAGNLLSLSIEGGTTRSDRPESAQARGPAERAQKPDKIGSTPINWTVSPSFVAEAARVDQSVRQQLPEGVRETLRNVKSTAVGMIDKGGASGFYNPETKQLLLAERPEDHSGLEPVLKHEFGHAFDCNQKNGKLLSDDPEFRKMVDTALAKDPALRQARKASGPAIYGEVFADLFASNVNANSNDLAIRNLDRRMPGAKEWVRRRMVNPK